MKTVEELKDAALAIVRSALEAADPGRAVRSSLISHGATLEAAGVRIPLSGRVFFVAVGKASHLMAEAALGVLGGKTAGGIVVKPKGYSFDLSARFPGVLALESGHPLPDEKGLEASRRIMELVGGMREQDVCLFLLSGGASSMLPLPHPPVRPEEERETTALLLRSGAGIRAVNTVRKHMSAIKGGRLAETCRGRIVTLAVSDVAGDDLSSIGSGPTVADPTTFADAKRVLTELSLWQAVPSAVRALVEDGLAGRVEETPKSLPDRHVARVIASNRTAVEAAMRQASTLGFAPLLLTTLLCGEAREAGRLLASVAREARRSGRPVSPPACILAAGETTVTVRGAGRGGRNQELALAAAMELEGEGGILLTSFATDGVDGVTQAAGAHASGLTAAAGRAAGLDPGRSLLDNDSHAFLSAAGELIVTGPTGANVNDLVFVLVD